MANRTCTVEDCGRDVHVRKRGLCRMHYLRWWRTGDPGPAEPMWQFNPPKCSIDGCDSEAIKRSWCNMHYQRWRIRGDVGSADRELDVSPPACTVNSCDRRPKAKGLCQAHYARVRNGGGPGAAEVREVIIRSEIGYQDVHYRVRYERGLPSEHMCKCGQLADEWAYDHADLDERINARIGFPYSLDLDHYLPLCLSCHRSLDAARSELIP